MAMSLRNAEARHICVVKFGGMEPKSVILIVSSPLIQVSLKKIGVAIMVAIMENGPLSFVDFTCNCPCSTYPVIPVSEFRCQACGTIFPYICRNVSSWMSQIVEFKISL
jgi:hypothetical protein